jgi:hypothetical protein
MAAGSVRRIRRCPGKALTLASALRRACHAPGATSPLRAKSRGYRRGSKPRSTKTVGVTEDGSAVSRSRSSCRRVAGSRRCSRRSPISPEPSRRRNTTCVRCRPRRIASPRRRKQRPDAVRTHRHDAGYLPAPAANLRSIAQGHTSGKRKLKRDQRKPPEERPFLTGDLLLFAIALLAAAR